MFTGIVETVGRIASVRRSGDGADLVIDAPAIAPELAIGQSVAVSGACLTVVRCDRRLFSVTAVGETMQRTVLGALKVGSRVNLERAMRVGDRLDGHLVQGHVDGVGIVTAVERTPPGSTLRVRLQGALLCYVAPKGSITVDGVSLTVTGVTNGGFGAALVPHTLQVTTLGETRTGSRVNVEVDLVARYLERLARGEGSSWGEDHVDQRG